ncbi:MAG: aminoacyl-tRNA hydrolase [Pseudomonadales bacterium]|nr:aminoacyl-tRNA hydrolase [Pseudomonadales bacterium]
MAIKLIVGLENPGPQYANTRHNVGGMFLAYLAQRFSIDLKTENKFSGRLGRGNICGNDVRLLIPDTYMNLSGKAVGSVAHFYKIAPEEILVAHDEMAFDPGVLRLKKAGGVNGHNGLRDIVGSLAGNANFFRFRIGVGHPGNANAVTAYLTSRSIPQAERELIESAWDIDSSILSDMISGNIQKAMNKLHAAPVLSGDK